MPLCLICHSERSEETDDVNAAIAREKEIKGWRRSKKIELIKSTNPDWSDLAEDWYDEEQWQEKV